MKNYNAEAIEYIEEAIGMISQQLPHLKNKTADFERVKEFIEKCTGNIQFALNIIREE